jgi:hypothetical protein
MAYENYTQISWTDGTPITGDRLQQMSTNTQQVKESTDDNPQGVKKLKTVTSTVGPFSDFQSAHEIISLKDDSGTGGGDNRVTIGASRYYRVTVNFPGFTVDTKGAEDSTYLLTLRSGVSGSANTVISTLSFTPPPFTFIDVSTLGANATIANNTLRNNSYDSKFGAGTYSVVLASNVSGFQNSSFFAAVDRNSGASANYAPAYSVVISSGTIPLQMYVEDIGGIA